MHRNIKAIIVDDEILIAEMVKSDLGKENVDSLIENDPNKVIELCEDEKPDVVFMDINLVTGDMSDKTGIKLGQRLEELGFVVIYMTAYISTQIAEFGLKYIVHKPYVDELVKMFNKVVLC